MNIVRIGLDLAKYVFHLHGVDERGKVVLRKALRRPGVAPFFANLPRCVVGMEASNGAHYWAKTLSEFGHDVRLISPQFVTPPTRMIGMTPRQSAKPSVVRTCGSCQSSRLNSWLFRLFIEFAVDWSPVGLDL